MYSSSDTNSSGIYNFLNVIISVVLNLCLDIRMATFHKNQTCTYMRILYTVDSMYLSTSGFLCTMIHLLT